MKLTDDELKRTLNQIQKIETLTAKDDADDQIDTIKKIAVKKVKRQKELLELKNTARPIVATGLVMRWVYTTHSRPRIERFLRLYPEVTTLKELRKRLDTKDEISFCRDYLNINTKGKLFRYQLINDLCNYFLDYCARNGFEDEKEGMLDWARKVDLDNIKDDPITQIPNVSEATVQNIIMALGLHGIKDDVHVTNARRRLRIPPEIKSHELAAMLGYDPIVLDKILFEWDRNYPE